MSQIVEIWNSSSAVLVLVLVVVHYASLVWCEACVTSCREEIEKT